MAEQFSNPNSQSSSDNIKTERLTGLGLAVSSLVLGILAVALSLMVIGGICGLVGLILAIVHLTKRYPLRQMAGWGLGLSIVGILGTSFAVLYIIGQIRDMRDTMSELESQNFNEWIGAEAPDFTVTDIDGKAIKLSELRGKKVLIDLWATWCPPCRMETPHLVKLRNTYDPNDLVLIGISSEDKQTIQDFAKKHRINYTLAAERKLPSPYGDATSIPTGFFIDRNGVIRYVLEGYNDYEKLNAFVSLLDKKQDPNEKEAKVKM
jgi:peroxiredoxin